MHYFKFILALCASLRFQQCALYIHEDEGFCIRTTADLTQTQEYLHLFLTFSLFLLTIGGKASTMEREEIYVVL